MINKIYLGRYKSAYNKIKVGKTNQGVGTRAKAISKEKGITFAPLIFARFKDLTGAETLYVESALRYFLSLQNDIEFIEKSNDHLKLLRKFDNIELLDLFEQFINTIPKPIMEKYINTEYYSKKSI